ncbi:MAG: adenosine kinase [Pseudomonadota bacterium]|nr:adenosine kinase [Pseudomonadota bacterium]
MKYHVYGIGNALVDKEFEVSDEFLLQQQIEKRVMTLIDDDAHIQLLDNLKQEFGLKKRAGGGSAANTMVAISQFGGNTFYACKVGDDEQGQFYMHDLHAAGVKTRLDQVKKEGMTGKCMVMVTPDAERTMNTFLGITTDFSVNELHFEDLKESEYLYIEGYLVTSDLSRAAVCKAREMAAEHQVKTALTFSDPSMVTYFRDGVSEIVGDGVDILFCNEEEAQIYTGRESLDEAIEELCLIAKKLVVTLGSKGALIINGNGRISIDAVPTRAVDTNGAGDMFAGTFLYAVTHGMSDRQAGELASRAASQIVSTFGARLEKSDHQALLQ